MKITIPSFPVLTAELKKHIGYKAEDFCFSYSARGTQYPLTLKEVAVASQNDTPAYNLRDEPGEWETGHFSTNIVRNMSIKTPQILFGPEGIAAHDATLGIAVSVISLTSNHRFAIPVQTFSKGDESVSGCFKFELPKSFYRDKIIFRSLLYLFDKGNPTEEEANLADLPGTVLGTLDEIIVFVDGTGSLFPVKKESDCAKPLWRVECDWTDPFYDLFSDENVCVIFNQAHPNYSLLKIEDGMNGSPFLADVIASALQIIITKTVEAVGGADELFASTDAVPGSILDAVRYFVSTFGWDPTAPERLAETIRMDFDRRTGSDK